VANTLTAILPKILARAVLVLRELAVMPRLVNGDYSSEAAKKGATINVPIPTARAATDVVPGPTPPTPADTTPATVPIALDNWKKSNFFLTDKDLHEIDRNESFLPLEMGEAVRALANEVNSSIHAKYKRIYGFTGTAGSTPFASTVVDATNARKVLNQQLAPRANRRGVLDFAADANALALAPFSDAEKVMSAAVKIEGEIGRKFGIDWVADDQVVTHTRGALGAGALTINGVNTAGATTISVAKGAGANWDAVEGDLITIAGDSQQYVITADTTVVQGTNTNVPISPALQVTTAGAEAITSIDTHVVNLVFHRDAFAFANRPLVATTLDVQLGNQIIAMTDPQTGVTLRLEVSRQYKQTVWELDILWGAELIRPALAARILG
jgi:hypothetical protein